MMVYPAPNGAMYPMPQVPVTPTIPAPDPTTQSNARSAASNPTSSEATSSAPLPFGPNFVAPSYVPSYMYPYDSNYQAAYGPPKKRAKRPQANNRSSAASARPPPSPGSDSAESSSSNASSAANSGAAAVEKAPKPKKFHCEPCEKSFKTQELYEMHLTSHVACSHDGCSYSASKGALKMHELLHVHNMFAKLSTPEEIAKYREERKKRFPSAARALELEAMREKEKAAKAAALERAQQQRLAQRNAYLLAKAEAASHKEGGEQLAPGAEEGPESRSSKEDPNPAFADDLAPQRTNIRGKRKRPVCKYWRQGHCNKGEQCSFSHANDADKPREFSSPNPLSTNANAANPSSLASHSASQSNRRNNPPATSKPGPKTLLSQFLLSEVSKENNLILQCLRFIVTQNFFSKPAIDNISEALTSVSTVPEAPKAADPPNENELDPAKNPEPPLQAATASEPSS